MEENTYVMLYKHCGLQWVDTWSCACDSECPKCGAPITPSKVYDSHELDEYQFNPADHATRDLLIWGEAKEWEGNQIRRYDGLGLANLEKLIQLGHADPDDAQNDAPPIKDMVEYMRSYPECDITAHGYAVSPGRSDYRVSVEGLCGRNLTQMALLDFINLFRHADDFDVGETSAYCWFD